MLVYIFQNESLIINVFNYWRCDNLDRLRCHGIIKNWQSCGSYTGRKLFEFVEIKNLELFYLSFQSSVFSLQSNYLPASLDPQKYLCCSRHVIDGAPDAYAPVRAARGTGPARRPLARPPATHQAGAQLPLAPSHPPHTKRALLQCWATGDL